MSAIRQVARFPGLKAMCVVLLFLQPICFAQSSSTVTLAWDPTPNVAGYKVHMGTASDSYSSTIDVGNTTSATVSDLITGTRYFFAVTAVNSSALESLPSNEVTFMPASNQSPTANLTSPASGTTLNAPATIALDATAADPDGSVHRVEFYSGSTKLGEDGSSPFSFTWVDVPAGNYSFTARAFDNQGASMTSSPATVTVLPPATVVAPGISDIAYLSDGSVEFTVSGTAGRVHHVYSSIDLQSWALLESTTSQNGSFVATDPTAGTVDKRFYRVSDGTITTDPVGFTKLHITGATATVAAPSSYLGLCLTNPVDYQGTVSSVGGSTLVDAQANWSDHQFNGANGEFWVEIVSGPFAGLTSDIVATDAAAKKLVIDDDLSPALRGGEVYKIRRHRTIADVFGPSNEAGLQGGSTAVASDEIRIFNAVTQEISIYYFNTGGSGGTGWRASTNPSTDVGRLKLYLDQGVIIRRKTAGDLKLILTGEVKLGPTIVPVGKNSNLLANLYPAGIRTLGNSGLYTGDPILGLAGSSGLSSADEVRIWNGTAFRKYYYKISGNGGMGWRSSSSSKIDASKVPLPPGSSFYVVRKNNRPAFNWTCLPPF